MTLTVGGKTTGVFDVAVASSVLTPRDRNALAALGLYLEQVTEWLAELHELEARRAAVEAALEDPALTDHPKRQDAVNRSVDQWYAIRQLIDEIGWKLADVVTCWQRLSPAGVEAAAAMWGTSHGPDVGVLWRAIGYRPTPLWAARRRRQQQLTHERRTG